jgi:ABC-type Fe3+ transport system permease subunit
MCTVSAIILIYRPSIVTATIGIVGLDDNGAVSAAAAMGTVVVAVCIVARLVEHFVRERFKPNTTVREAPEDFDASSLMLGLKQIAP